MKIISQHEIQDVTMSKKVAQEFFDKVLRHEPHFTVFLEGGLGLGKTFFVREILRHFGVRDDVPSPTFTLCNEYKNSESKTSKSSAWHHYDFYRLESPDEFFTRGFAEMAQDHQISKFVEWPDKISPEVQKAFSGKHFWISLERGRTPEARLVKFFERL